MNIFVFLFTRLYMKISSINTYNIIFHIFLVILQHNTPDAKTFEMVVSTLTIKIDKSLKKSLIIENKK